MEGHRTVRMLAIYIFTNLTQDSMVYDQPRTAVERVEMHRHDLYRGKYYCMSRRDQYRLLNLLHWSSRMHCVAPST